MREITIRLKIYKNKDEREERGKKITEEWRNVDDAVRKKRKLTEVKKKLSVVHRSPFFCERCWH